MTRGVPPLRLRSSFGLARRRCLPCLLANQTALTPSAKPPGKPGLHHSDLPLLSSKSHSDPGSPTPLHRLLVPACDAPAVSARTESRCYAHARRTTPTVSPTWQSTFRAPLLGAHHGRNRARRRPRNLARRRASGTNNLSRRRGPSERRTAAMIDDQADGHALLR